MSTRERRQTRATGCDENRAPLKKQRSPQPSRTWKRRRAAESAHLRHEPVARPRARAARAPFPLLARRLGCPGDGDVGRARVWIPRTPHLRNARATSGWRWARVVLTVARLPEGHLGLRSSSVVCGRALSAVCRATSKGRAAESPTKTPPFAPRGNSRSRARRRGSSPTSRRSPSRG